MSISPDRLIDQARQCGAVRAALFDTSTLSYSREFRRLCEQNKCGHYGKNWMCPPAVGAFEELKAKAARYTCGLVFQTVHTLSHSLDRKGMRAAFVEHDRVLSRIKRLFTATYAMKDVLALGAGPCTQCPTCSAVNGSPCPYPDRAYASVESYGIDVAELVRRCEIPYHNGKNTVSYVGCILFMPDEDAHPLKTRQAVYRHEEVEPCNNPS
ncbi:MAG TPA: DUF2284 domain-containing protein [Syntrophorhabdaceae bacterium]|nr:DUF2284 domain-containing protein [Syntrophorhabdaceae bacterium]